jgi:uncharacterized membrane protein YbhN (UPF0104 family)
MPETQTPPPAKPRLFTPRSIGIVVVLVIVLGVWLSHAHISFDWRSLGTQLRSVSLPGLLIAVAISYIGYLLRAWRWAVLMGPIRKTSILSMYGPQLIGFALVGLFGRVADLARPYLIARRTQTTVATQLAIYSIERAFDLGAAAILFSTTLAFAPRDMPHHEAFARAGIVSLAATLFLAVFAVSLRLAGAKVAAIAGKLTGALSPKLGEAVTTHILSFAEGMKVLSSFGEFLLTLALSLVMWLGIAFAYIVTAHAFHASPQLAGLTFAATMLLMATSMGGSVLQLPIVGWFTQIALLAAALHGFFDVPLETATACSALLLVVMNLVVIPGGLIAARLEGISLMDAAQTPTPETIPDATA